MLQRHAKPNLSAREMMRIRLRALEPALWTLFLVWTAMAFVIMPFDLGDMDIRAAVKNPGLRSALIAVWRAFDVVWVMLAAVNTYLFVAFADGIGTARRWALLLLGATFGLAWIGARTAFPFGPIFFTERLGPRMAGVPIALPFLWFAIIVNARYLVLALAPKSDAKRLALGTAAAVLFTDLNLEMVAWKARAYWIWYPGRFGGGDFPPIQNYIAWFAIALLLAPLMRERRLLRTGTLAKPVVTILLINVLFLTVHAVRWLRS